MFFVYKGASILAPTGPQYVTSCTYVVPVLVLVHEQPYRAEEHLFQTCQVQERALVKQSGRWERGTA